jgi:hypothetical protein
MQALSSMTINEFGGAKESKVGLSLKLKHVWALAETLKFVSLYYLKIGSPVCVGPNV